MLKSTAFPARSRARLLSRPVAAFRLLAVIVLAGLVPGLSRSATRAVPSTTTPAALAAQISAHIGLSRFASADWGVAVVSLDTGRTLYAHRADRLLLPASTAKLYTAALALSTVGTGYRLPTKLLSNGRISKGMLQGSLVLYGSGDPTLGTADTNTDWADQLASQLAARGVRRIRGDLVADDTYFAGPLIGSGWEAGDLQSGFAAPSSALSVQENVVRIAVAPGRAIRRPALLTAEPAIAMPPLLNRLTTSAPGSRSDINLYRVPGDSILHAFGSIAGKSPVQTFKLAMVDPACTAGLELRQALRHRGIAVTGTLHVLHWPQDDQALRTNAVTLAQIQSPPLGEILRRGLKRSQNLYLQNLLLTAGVHAQAELANTADAPLGFVSTEAWGERRLRRLLDRIGIPASASQLQEGTGLSRQDLTTPDALVRLLGFLAAQPYAAQLRDALPLAGVDGTLIGRMRGTAAAGNVQAKTGSMNFTRDLAGFVTTASGEKLAFAIMLNNYARPHGAPRASSDLDAIAVMLANYRGRTASAVKSTGGARD